MAQTTVLLSVGVRSQAAASPGISGSIIQVFLQSGVPCLECLRLQGFQISEVFALLLCSCDGSNLREEPEGETMYQVHVFRRVRPRQGAWQSSVCPGEECAMEGEYRKRPGQDTAAKDTPPVILPPTRPISYHSPPPNNANSEPIQG